MNWTLTFEHTRKGDKHLRTDTPSILVHISCWFYSTVNVIIQRELAESWGSAENHILSLTYKNTNFTMGSKL